MSQERFEHCMLELLDLWREQAAAGRAEGEMIAANIYAAASAELVEILLQQGIHLPGQKDAAADLPPDDMPLDQRMRLVVWAWQNTAAEADEDGRTEMAEALYQAVSELRAALRDGGLDIEPNL